MQTVLSSSTLPAVAAGVLAPALKQHSSPLEYMFERIKLNMVPLNAHDVYSLCTTAFHSDTIGMLQDADFMRGIADAFARCDQSLLNPFQNSLIADTLRRAGINVSPNSLSVPEEDAVSPAALLNVLRSMNITRTRDERKIEEVIKLLIPLMDECTQVELVMFVAQLSELQWANADVLVRLANRALQDDTTLNTSDVSLLTKSLALVKGVPFNLHRRMMSLIESRLDDFQPEDYLSVLKGLQALGPRYCHMFGKVVEAGLDNVESMDSLTLTHFLICFTELEYRNREHIEIYADALVDVAHELRDRELVQSFIALQRLNLLSESMFITMLNCFMPFINSLEPRFIAPVIEVCSVVPHSSEQLMSPMLNRIMDCVRQLTPNECGEIIDAIALYPPAKEHAVVQFLGRQAHLRIEIMSTNSVAKATRGLAYLGYNDPEFYTLAAEHGFRYGMKDWPTLEPILMGLCLSNSCSISVVKIAVNHLQHIARSLTLKEVQRAYQYLTRLHCEEDYIYRVLATRALQFVKEITPDMPEDLQALLQRGAVTTTSTEGK